MNAYRPLATAAAGLLAFLAAACGSGDDGGFTFTPVPYTVFPEPQCESISCSDAYYLTDDCRWNAADQVQLIVQVEHRDDVVDWMLDRGFLIAEEYNRTDDNTVYFLIAVPRGAVPAALARLRERAGVTFVGPNELVFGADTVPAFIQDCRKTREAQ